MTAGSTPESPPVGWAGAMGTAMGMFTPGAADVNANASMTDNSNSPNVEGCMTIEFKPNKALAAAILGAKVYKAFNTVGVEHMKAALGKDMMFAGNPNEASLQVIQDVVKGVGFKPFYVGPIRYARNLEAIAKLWIHMAVPPLGGHTTSRNFWFLIAGDP